MGPDLDYLFHWRYKNSSTSKVFSFGVFFDGLNDLAKYLVCRNHELDLKFFDNVNHTLIQR